MPTISQLIKNSRSVEKKKSKSRALQNEYNSITDDLLTPDFCSSLPIFT